MGCVADDNMPRGRGRGRGGRGGRFGRGGRGRGGNRQSTANAGGQANETAAQVVDIDAQPKEFFVGVVSSEEHMKAQEQNRPRYAASLAVLQKNGVVIAQSKLNITLTVYSVMSPIISQFCPRAKARNRPTLRSKSKKIHNSSYFVGSTRLRELIPLVRPSPFLLLFFYLFCFCFCLFVFFFVWLYS